MHLAHKFRKKALMLLGILMLLFFLIFLFAYFQSQKGSEIFDIGLPGDSENTLIMAFSILSLAKVVYEIYKVEHIQ